MKLFSIKCPSSEQWSFAWTRAFVVTTYIKFGLQFLEKNYIATEREFGNVVDRYAVTVIKDSGEMVGHLPKKISRMCSMFIQEGGEILCIVIGNRRYSSDLVHGGLEIPCTLLFRGEEKYTQKLKKLIYLKDKLKCKVIVKQN